MLHARTLPLLLANQRLVLMMFLVFAFCYFAFFSHTLERHHLLPANPLLLTPAIERASNVSSNAFSPTHVTWLLFSAVMILASNVLFITLADQTSSESETFRLSLQRFFPAGATAILAAIIFFFSWIVLQTSFRVLLHELLIIGRVFHIHNAFYNITMAIVPYFTLSFFLLATQWYILAACLLTQLETSAFLTNPILSIRHTWRIIYRGLGTKFFYDFFFLIFVDIAIAVVAARWIGYTLYGRLPVLTVIGQLLVSFAFACAFTHLCAAAVVFSEDARKANGYVSRPKPIRLRRLP